MMKLDPFNLRRMNLHFMLYVLKCDPSAYTVRFLLPFLTLFDTDDDLGSTRPIYEDTLRVLSCTTP